MAENWWLIVVVLLVIGIGLWWLLGRPKEEVKPPVREKSEPKPLEREAASPPIVLIPTATPVDVPPPPPPATAAAPKPRAKPKPKAAEPAPASKPAAPAKKAAPKAAAPKAAAPKKAAAKAPATPDNLLLLKGVGPKLVTLLNGLGVTRFDQISAWKAADIAVIDEKLGTFKGRATRDQWVEQAGFLAKGDRAGFEAKFGKLEG